MVELTRRANSPAGFMRKWLIRQSSSCSGPVGWSVRSKRGSRASKVAPRERGWEGRARAARAARRDAKDMNGLMRHLLDPKAAAPDASGPGEWGEWPANKGLPVAGGQKTSLEIRCQFIILGNPVSVHHSCPKRRTDTGLPYIILARKDELTSRQEARERRIVTTVKPFAGTLRVTNPARKSRASSRKRVLRGGWVTTPAKRRQPDQTLCD